MRVRRLEGITAAAWTLSLVSFFADVSSELIYPIMPLFLTGTLGAPAIAVGVTEGVAEGVANVTKLVSGRWADRFGNRKAFVVSGYGLAVAGKLIVALAYAWPVATIGRAVDRFGKGVRTAPRDAILADASEARYRGRVFGLHRSMDTLGAVVGPLIGLAFLAFTDVPLRVMIAVSVPLGLLAVVALRWLRDPGPRRVAPAAHAAASEPGGALPGRFYAFLGVSMIFMAGNSSDAFLILRSRDLGLSLELVVLAYVAYNLVYAATSLPAGIVSDRIPRPVLLIAGYVVFGLVYLGFAGAGSSWVVWPLFAVYGAYIALTDGVSKALVTDLVAPSTRSSALGLYQGLTGLAALGASIAAGLLWDQVSEAAPFVLGASAAFLGAAGMLALQLGGSLRPAPEPVLVH
jgi:MFS family permease